MNSENPYYITQAQALGAPSVLKFGLEPLPTAYIIIGEGTTAWFVGAAKGIPFEKSNIAEEFFLLVKDIFENWDQYKQLLSLKIKLRKKIQYT